MSDSAWRRDIRERDKLNVADQSVLALSRQIALNGREDDLVEDVDA